MTTIPAGALVVLTSDTHENAATHGVFRARVDLTAEILSAALRQQGICDDGEGGRYLATRCNLLAMVLPHYTVSVAFWSSGDKLPVSISDGSE